MKIVGRANVPLDTSELQALTKMAKDAVRHPREQLRYLLRCEAQRRGLLPQAKDIQAATEQLDDRTTSDPQINFDRY